MTNMFQQYLYLSVIFYYLNFILFYLGRNFDDDDEEEDELFKI